MSRPLYDVEAARRLLHPESERSAGPPTPRPGPSLWSGAFLRPRHWATFIGFGLLRITAFLPYAWRVRLGRLLGDALGLALRKRRHIARVNLALCFPEMDETEREACVVEHFRAFGVALFEMGAVWWAPPSGLSPLASFQGLEHLRAALAGGRGAILLSGHYASMEMGVAHLARALTSNVVYRPHNDPTIDSIIQLGRTRYPGQMVKRNDFRGMVNALRRNEPLWYPPDQDFGRRHSVFVEFFGHPAATITATARLARIARAPVLPFYTRRLPGKAGYEVIIGPALEGFPSGDDEQDALRANRVIEAQIRADVPQYLWCHRRFKTRAAPGEDLYAR